MNIRQIASSDQLATNQNYYRTRTSNLLIQFTNPDTLHRIRRYQKNQYNQYSMLKHTLIILFIIAIANPQFTNILETSLNLTKMTHQVQTMISSINALDQQKNNSSIQLTPATKTLANLNQQSNSGSVSYNIHPFESGTINIATNQAVTNENQYFMAYKQTISNIKDIVTLVSMDSFNSFVNDSISFNIQKVKTNQTGLSFSFSTSNNIQWTNTKLNFLTTSRPDIELGNATYNPLSAASTPGYLSYLLKKDWAKPSQLKVILFLSGFSGISKGGSIGFLILNQYIQRNLFIVQFQQQNNSTISMLTFDIIIFDPFNKALRFQYALFSETYLQSLKFTSLPPEIDGETRVRMTGLREFVVETSTQFSLLTVTEKSENYTFFKYGPTQNGCFFNYLSMSYLFLSFNPCGFCKATYAIYNGTCFNQCPHGTKPAPRSTCQPILCPTGTYLADDNLCHKCPQRSNILQCHNACSEDEYLEGETCYPKCNSSLHLTYKNKNCVCMENYFNISNKCGQCEEGTLYSASFLSCLLICKTNQHYNITLRACECNQGLYYIGLICGICSENQYYNASNRACFNKCSQKQQYSNGKCLCLPGYVRASNQSCVSCQSGTSFDYVSQSCKSICGQNQTWSINKCICKPNYLIINNHCSQCKSGELYNPILLKCRLPCLQHELYNDSNDSCYCKTTFNKFGNKCLCPNNSIYNSSRDLCLCLQGYSMSPSIPYLCISVCRENQIYTQGKCSCKDGFFFIDGKCTQCPQNTIYDQNYGICRPPCSLNQQFSLISNKCICIPGYYIINKVCGQCDISETYDSQFTRCVKKCPDPKQIYNVSSGKCICAPNYYLVNNNCELCPAGQFYQRFLNGSWKCFANCQTNEIFNSERLKCECQQGFFNISGKGCSLCPTGQIYQPITLKCIPICPINMRYDQNMRKCACIDGFGLKNGQCVNCGPCSQINLFTGLCQCLTGFYLIKGTCGTCPIGTTYNTQTETCLVSCPQHSSYDILKGLCICSNGYYMDYENNKCIQSCPAGQYFDSGKCKCINPRQVLHNGQCYDPLNCPLNSYFHVESYCCLCKQGFRLSNNSCLPFDCGPNSYDYNGICVCNKGFYMVRGVCQSCHSNEVYNGVECVCLNGYTRNQNNQCVTNAIPVCSLNEVYSYTQRQCVCLNGYQYVMGRCQLIPNCPLHANWNGFTCQCNSGYIMVGNMCKQVNSIIPTCPINSEFNGVSCSCKQGYYQIKPGYCGICPFGSYWNGHQCSSQTQCDIGYAISPFDGQCISVGQLCGPGARWSGVTCCCLPGYNNIGKSCVKCPEGTYFDGSACSSSPGAANKCGSNEIFVNGKCQCISGFHLINGVCIQCPEFTFWNGAYCQCLTSDPSKWCLGIPFSIKTVTGCQCQAGYYKLNGLCVQG